MTENGDAEKSFVEVDARAFRSGREDLRARLEGSGDLGAWNEWLRQELSGEDFIIEEQEASAYRLPSKVGSFLPASLIQELSELLSLAREISNQLVGIRISEAQVVLAGDQRAEEIERRLRVWAEEYVSYRANRSRHRTGRPMALFKHLYYELLPDLEKISYSTKSANRCFFSEFTDYLPWLIFQRYCGHMLEVRFDEKKLETVFRINSEHEVEKAFLSHIVTLYQWQRTDNLCHVMALLEKSLPAQENHLTSEQLRRKLEMLAADIRVMRPFLVHNYNSENVLIEMAPGVWISWMWAVGIGEGIIWLAPSRESMIAQQRARTNRLSLLLQYDGLLSGHITSWTTIDSILAKQEKALLLSLKIVEAIHAELLSFYAKVDVQAILERFKKRPAEEAISEPSEEEFAAICQSIAEPVEEDELSRKSTGFSAIRVKRLLSILSDRLGCEVRPGKGSEIVVFRAGGHHFRLGHHKRNSYVPTPVIRNLLRHVGVGIQEWIEAIG